MGERAYEIGSLFATYLGSITSGQGIVNVTSVSELLVLSAAPAAEFPTLAGGIVSIHHIARAAISARQDWGVGNSAKFALFGAKARSGKRCLCSRPLKRISREAATSPISRKIVLPREPSTVGGVKEAPIISEVRQRSQVAYHFDGKALDGWHAVYPVNCQADGEDPCPGVCVRHL